MTTITKTLNTQLTHHASSDDDPDTDTFYDTIVSLIDEMTHRVNDDENAIEIEYDEELMSITTNADYQYLLAVVTRANIQIAPNQLLQLTDTHSC